MVDIVDLFVNVVDVGVPHCRICYRTSKEIKLVRPDKLLEFSSCLKQHNVFGPAALDLSACILCEAAAVTAMRLMNALNTAVTIKGIIQNLRDNLITGRMYSQYLKQNVGPCNLKLDAYRERTTLKKTEVLLVDSVGLEWSNKNSGENKGPTRVDLPNIVRENPVIETVVLDDEDDTPKDKVSSYTQTAAPEKSSKVPIQTSTSTQKLIPINQLLNSAITDKHNYAALVPNQMRLITGHPTLKDSFILHDVLLAKDGTLTVPGIACEIKNGQLKHNCCLISQYTSGVGANQVSNSKNSAAPANTSSVPVKVTTVAAVATPSQGAFITDTVNTAKINVGKNTPNTVKPNIEPNGRFLSTQSLNNTTFNNMNRQTETDNQTGIGIIDVRGSNTRTTKNSDSIQLVEIDDILEKKLDNNKRKSDTLNATKKPRKESITEVNTNSVRRGAGSDQEPNSPPVVYLEEINKEEPIAVISEVTSQAEPSQVGVQEYGKECEKRPIEQKGRIDWEDKIPMDVISFMDATDPNAEQLIVPDPLSQTQPTVVKEENDVIDLC